MNKHTLNLLEFNKIKERLKTFCYSPQGRRLLEEQHVGTEKKVIREWRELTGAFKALFTSGEKIPAFTFPEIEHTFKTLSVKGSFLDPEELYALGSFIVSSRQMKNFIATCSENELLKARGGEIPLLESLEKEIFRIIGRQGEIKESKIPELREIKKAITALRGQVNNLVKSYLSDPSYRTYWQSDTPVSRDGRVVLPLKANFKGRVKGIVHEVSSSGATVFLEPHDVVEKNNRIVTEESNYHKVLIKVLQQLTAKVAEHLEEIRECAGIVAFLDSFQARAAYSLKTESFPARESQKGEVRLFNARHPLLGKGAVPITVDINPGTRVLIITGPNTGGKTVTLKTVALLSLMNQFGMEIPAGEESRLPYFDQVLGDIGDEQSLEQSLSTFSAHIRNLTGILKRSTASSLVLLDELGAGTDPEEGVAIAMSILDHFIDKGTMVLSTTHHGILKNYGYTREGVENASMDFDDHTHHPRYRLIMGLPGESHALSIAAHHGIPRSVLDKARSYLNDERSDISRLIKNLSAKKKQLLEEERAQELRSMELEEKKRMADLKDLRLRQREMELRGDGLRELKNFISHSRSRLENMIRELREGEMTREQVKAAREIIAGVEEEALRQESKLKEAREEILPLGDVEIEVGMEVRLKSTKKTGRVVRKGKGNRWVIETGALKVTLEAGDFEPVEVKNPRKQVIIETASVESSSLTPQYNLRLLGMRRDEALAEVEKQIDRAIIKGMKEFNIIHGKGDGILQKGVHEYLKKCPYVHDYFFSDPEGGGFGRTIVILKN